jgi:exopolyphosphatase / guanosine-5'-triphosphate,3'-diphosphate pyrophosphatase
MILAGIDIGTNTLRLLIAETGPDSFREIYSDRRITRLGQDLDRRGRFSPNAEERSLHALSDFTTSIRRHAVTHVASVGTSAFRTATNAAEYIIEVQKRIGLAIRIISGEEEARLTLLGVTHALKGLDRRRDDPLASACVVDIGGGSTEIIMTRHKREPLIISLPLGAVYLTERFIKHDPPARDEIEFLRSTIRGVLEYQSGDMRPEPAGIFVGTAGTITTLAAMDQGLMDYDADKINRYIMTEETIDAMVADLTRKTLKEREDIPGLEQGREDIILAGAVIAQEIMKRFGFSTMIVSDWGLREGIVMDLHARLLKSVLP